MVDGGWYSVSSARFKECVDVYVCYRRLFLRCKCVWAVSETNESGRRVIHYVSKAKHSHSVGTVS